MNATVAKNTKPPAYRRRKGYSQAIVTLTDAQTRQRKDYWLGEYGSPGSQETYYRVLADWESNGRRLPPPANGPKATVHRLIIDEVIHAYKAFVAKNYKIPSQQTIFMALHVLRQCDGMTPVEEFGPKRLRLVRERMIKGDSRNDPPRKAWSRPTINKAVHQIVAMFKWAASHEMLPGTVYQQLKSVAALRRGHSEAGERRPVQPVSIDTVAATKPFLSRQVKALVDLQLLTGARGGELFRLRPIDLDMDETKNVWLVRSHDHKTAHLGHDRIIYFGPKAQVVIRSFLTDRPVDAFLFNPREAEAERRAALAAKRKTPLRYGNGPGTNRVENPKLKPGDHYTAASYRRAIERACDKVGVPRWHPHQLRHTAATIIRQQFGLEAARIALGHSSALVTDAIYAERDMGRVVDVMTKIG